MTIDNYLLWKAQIVPYLKEQQRYGYFDRTTPAPPRVITISADGATQALQNSEFRHWHLQDQMILSAIISSLSEKILTRGKIYHLSRCLASIRTHVHLPIQG